MSLRSHEQWTQRESIELLVNVLQGHHRNQLVSVLVQLVQDSRLAPQWEAIALPPGHSIQTCQRMYQTLMHQGGISQSFPPVAPQHPAAFHPAYPQYRSYSEHPHPQPQPPPRAIQPRPSPSTDSPNPASTNGEALTIVRTLGPELGGERRKKRGRPTKEEVEERSALLAAEGKVYEPKKRPAKKFRASTGTPIPISEQESISPAMQTPLPQTVEAKEESSSGKRRSKRQSSLTGVHTQVEPISPTTRTGEDKPAESPSDRLLARWSRPEGDPTASAGPSNPPIS